MTTVTDIAERILAENNWTTGTISAQNAEYMVKNAVDYVNLMAGTSISFTPSAGSEDLTADDDEIVVVKFASVIMFRAYTDRGPNSAGGPIGISAVIADPQYNFYNKQLELMIERLRQSSGEDIAFVVAEDDSGIDE